MLDCASRSRVEAIRNADTVSIRINEGTVDEMTITIRNSGKEIKKLSHDIALAVQDYFNRF